MGAPWGGDTLGWGHLGVGAPWGGDTLGWGHLGVGAPWGGDTLGVGVPLGREHLMVRKTSASFENLDTLSHFGKALRLVTA